MSEQNERVQAIRARLAPDFERVLRNPETLDAWVATLTPQEQTVVTAWLAESTAKIPDTWGK